MKNVVQAKIDINTIYALKEDGSLWGWGQNTGILDPSIFERKIIQVQMGSDTSTNLNMKNDISLNADTQSIMETLESTDKRYAVAILILCSCCTWLVIRRKLHDKPKNIKKE